MKICLTIMMIMITVVSVSAQSISININLDDGSVVSFSIEDIKKITFDPVVDIKDIGGIVKAIKTFSLLQNYPNPFNPTTTIEYDIPNDGDVRIIILTINGQKVKEYLFSSQKSGRYRIVWDGKNDKDESVASGLYIYSAVFGNETIAKKMILLK